MLRIEAGCSSDRGDRENNEDRAGIFCGGRVCAIADGMGGQAGGEVASDLAVETVQRGAGSYLATEAEEQAILPGLKELFAEANQRILAAGRDDLDLGEMGTTLTVGLVRGERLFFAHVGDSRLYLWRRDHCEQLTTDHTEAQELVRQGWLSQEASSRSIYRHVLSRWLGTIRPVEPQLGERQLQAGDRLLLCSDGLYGEIEALALGELLGSASAPQETADALVAAAKQNGSGKLDNITAVVVGVGG